MKILLVHNFYGSSAPSGENTVYLAERDLLLGHGHNVSEFIRHSDEIRNRGAVGTLQGAFSTPWNPFAVGNLRRLLEQEQPDVMHVHNTFPLLSPAVFRAVRGLGTATVLTLHNYRTFCAAGVPLRNGVVCTECLDRHSVLPALKYGCYRNGRTATIPLAVMISLHHMIGTWRRDVDAFIVFTGFQRDKMTGAGLPAERIHIKPHFYPDPPRPLPWEEREPKVIFIGRLGAEKGINVLMEAWNEWGKEAPCLEIIGDGPERAGLEKAAGKAGLMDKIHFRGQLPFSEVQERLARASLLVLPSLCFEGFPMVIREAFALGVPVAASRLGSMPDIVTDGENGVLFEPDNSEDLCRVVKDIWGAPEKLSAMATAAGNEYERKYTPERNLELLMKIYRNAKEVRERR